jgi:hypothetical protein
MANLLTRLESQLTFPTRATQKLFAQVQKMDQMMIYASSIQIPISALGIPTSSHPLEHQNDIASGSGSILSGTTIGWNGEGEGSDKTRVEQRFDELALDQSDIYNGEGSGALDDWSEAFDLGPEMVFPDLADWFA